ncbi:MAG: 2-isopropylmalate synthase [Opitutales bacterium]
MNTDKAKKYIRDSFVCLKDRTWPDATIEAAPSWCSVDLRDGNQALAIPMTIEQKLELYNMLLKVGFKEIEVGFPAASDTEFNFLRKLIDEDRIPEGVTVQVLTQSREPLIRKTFEAIKGAKSAIVHLYNSTSVLQRKVTFKMEKEEIIAIAQKGVTLVRQLADELEKDGAKISLEYSPESFSDTEAEFALEICEAVKAIWKPTLDNKIIINLPSTVEYTTPNIYADQIEWVSRNISNRDCVSISLHTHNDRGTGVAATELGLLAGADRVEGTLFGNGERTGNLDIVNVALNLFASGIKPNLDFSNLQEVIDVYESATAMSVHPRQPYAGSLVFTAFSGSHQDAIKKGMDIMAQDKDGNTKWAVPYLLIDPMDIGRDYEAIIRINSQSGKGGVAYILNTEFAFDLPKEMHPQVGTYINNIADSMSKELSPTEIFTHFKAEFLNRESPLALVNYATIENINDSNEVKLKTSLNFNNKVYELESIGNGPINAFVKAIKQITNKGFRLIDYRSHAINSGSDSKAVAYISLERDSDKSHIWACGVDPSIETAGIKALVSAFNRL